MKTTLFIGLVFNSLIIQAATNDHFVTTWKTDNPGDSSDTSITITTHSGSSYSYNVDWDNDEIFDEFNITGDITHDFGTVGEPTIRISGNFPRILFKFNEKITEINQWGTNAWTSMDSAFWGASNVINLATDTPDLTNCTNLSFMFQSASLIGGSTDTGNWDWDTSTIDDFGHAFFLASKFNKDITSWQTANVISMADMFTNTHDFNQNLASWNFENVTNFGVTDFINSNSFSFENYDNLLISLASQDVNSNLLMKVTSLHYCTQAAIDARDVLINTHGWNILDSGIDPSCNPQVDLRVIISNFEPVNAGDLLVYTILVDNIGGLDAVNAKFSDILPTEIIATSWTCNPSLNNSCTASGTGQIDDTISIESESGIFYQVSATITSDSFTDVFYQVQIDSNINQVDSDLTNNYSSNYKVNTDVVFHNSFETQPLIFHSKDKFFEFDFSKIDKSLGELPKTIAKGLDTNGVAKVWIHVRKINQQLQIRMSNKYDGIWHIGQWQNVNNVLTTIERD